MSDLSTGGSYPEGWSIAQPIHVGGQAVYGKGIWVERLPAKIENIQAIGGFDSCDLRSIGGLWSARWSTLYDDYYEVDPSYKSGGLGSAVYQTQKVGDGVKFTKTSIWYELDGDYIKGIPPNLGAYHTASTNGETYNSAGPMPGSPAAQLLGDGHYVWNEIQEWYEVSDDSRC